MTSFLSKAQFDWPRLEARISLVSYARHPPPLARPFPLLEAAISCAHTHTHAIANAKKFQAHDDDDNDEDNVAFADNDDDDDDGDNVAFAA